jgi:NTP pyrophosphatase (non-canonical NTP hydrolase)
MSYVLDEIATERSRQDSKFGAQNHDPATWVVILGEEYGEVCKEVCEARFALEAIRGEHQRGDYAGAGLAQQSHINFLRKTREELVQVAAVAVAMIESLDRNELGRKRDG